MITDFALLKLLQLVSPGLPIGMYSYSQGLERAVEDGLLNNAGQVAEWLEGLLHTGLQNIDIPIAARLYDAWQNDDSPRVDSYCQLLLAHRESAELRAEERQTGQALARLLADMGMPQAQARRRDAQNTLSAMYMLAAVNWHIPKYNALLGYLWSWLENQVLCAVKLVPLGQVAGQRLLQQQAERIPQIIAAGMSLSDHEIGGSAFSLALCSSRHEMQYSRLFRS